MDVFTFMVDVHNNHGYCEAVVLKDGSIEYAPRGHINKMIELSGHTEADIWELMPITAAPIYWLPEFTGIVPIWEQFYMTPTYGMTAAQAKTIQDLVVNKVIQDKAMVASLT